MDNKDITIIHRFVDGERDLQSKLVTILEENKSEDSIYTRYLTALLIDDDVQETMKHKQEIRKEIKHAKIKPSFTRRSQIKEKDKRK